MHEGGATSCDREEAEGTSLPRLIFKVGTLLPLCRAVVHIRNGWLVS